MSVYSSASGMLHDSADWSETIGTWKIGTRDQPLAGVRRTSTSSDTKLVGNFDPVSGKHFVAHFSVGSKGWRNHRKREAPDWMLHAHHAHPHRRIAAPRQAQLGERKFAMRENAATPSALVFYGDAMPMEGRTVLATTTSVKTSPPHPARKFAETMKRMMPEERLPRRIRLQQSAEREQQELGGQVPMLSASGVHHLLQKLVIDSLEDAMKQLEQVVSKQPAEGILPGTLEQILFSAHWKCDDKHILALRRVYACDAGVDAELVIKDMFECIRRPGFSAARYPACMQLVVASLVHRMRILEARFQKSDDEARENNKCVGARERGEERAYHVDAQVFAQHLLCCGFPADSIVMTHLQRLYCCAEGLWKGYLDYGRFLIDLWKVSSRFLAASNEASYNVFNPSAHAEPYVISEPGLRSNQGPAEGDYLSFEGESHGEGQGRNKSVDFWVRPSTGESEMQRQNAPSMAIEKDVLRPATSESTRFSSSSRATPWQQNRVSSSSASAFFGDSTAILRQGSKYEGQLRKRMALIFHKLDDIHRCFRDLDMRRCKAVSERAAEDILRPYASNLLLKDVTWLITRFSSDGFFRFEEFVAWCEPPTTAAEDMLPPQLLGQVPTSSNYTVSMRGGLVQRTQVKDEGTMAFQPSASRHQLRMPPPPRKISTPAEWASKIVGPAPTR